MATPQAALAHYEGMQSLQSRALVAATRWWRRVDVRRPRTSWRQLGPGLIALATQAQQSAAVQGAAYVPLVLAELDVAADPVATPVPASLAGVASDGRPLESLLYQPLREASVAVAGGTAPAAASASGLSALESILLTQIADAGRLAESLGITARPAITGYVRMLNLPSCGRCIILAGRRYRWNTGFDRHPRCDCVHIPATENVAGDIRTNPRAAFDSLTPAEQSHAFTKAGAQAIRDGADLAQVVNARRGMATAQIARRDILFTREGMTRRGQARRTGVRGPRLMPETIYGVAEDRADALRLLQANGYIRGLSPRAAQLAPSGR